jgi:hypothetical protein
MCERIRARVFRNNSIEQSNGKHAPVFNRQDGSVQVIWKRAAANFGTVSTWTRPLGNHSMVPLSLVAMIRQFTSQAIANVPRTAGPECN